MSGFYRSLWRNANSAPEIFFSKNPEPKESGAASLSSCRRLYQRSTCRRTHSMSYSGSMRQANRFGFSNGQNRKAAAYKISAGRSGLASFFFGGQIRSVRPGRHERAGTATVAARRTRFQIGFCHQWYASSTADRFPNMPLQYRAAVFTCVLGVAAIIGVCERLVALWASQHGYLTYHVTGQFL